MEYDYRYSSQDNKQLIIEVLCDAYNKGTKKKLAFHYKDDLTLLQYTTSKLDSKRGNSKRPKDAPQFLDLPELKNNMNAKGNSSLLFCKNKLESDKLSLEDFTLLKLLGKGAYGKVLLC